MPPAIGLIGAVATGAEGLAAFSAATSIGGELIGGAMMAGAAMSGIGALTGNKTLSNLGSLVGLAGGAAGMLSGNLPGVSSFIADNSSASGDMFSGVSYGGQAGGSLGGYDVNGPLTGQGLPGGAQGGSDMFSGVNYGGASGQQSGMLGSGPSLGGMSQVAQGTQVVGSLTGSNPLDATTFGGAGAMPGQAGGTGLQQITGPGGQIGGVPTAANATPGSIGGAGAAGVPASAPSSGGGMLQSVLQAPGNALQWATANPNNARVAQGILGVVGGVGQSIAQQEALKQQLAAQEAVQARARARLNASVQGLNMPVYQKPGG